MSMIKAPLGLTMDDMQCVFAEIERAGYKIVPVEATEEMVQKAAKTIIGRNLKNLDSSRIAVWEAWDTALAAAPKVVE